jgi:hypothetical protein
VEIWEAMLVRKRAYFAAAASSVTFSISSISCKFNFHCLGDLLQIFRAPRIAGSVGGR